ncbi:FAD/NAD(P)-binding domain-containing protein [Bimuria novae-zelandiae CBS 107.79]|uniref:FAD/NAD(P)-binding domain-containing protein n=1 Tax=Bimuria novae-zelandiae CBS 107.79 TaxID=1447943 RepID=A0A6A5VDE8_9PLEO|nr:FAD/NAD(P)-binding domain-containing protein [Bimuria novae-zelandiae CBS 107.79]
MVLQLCAVVPSGLSSLQTLNMANERDGDHTINSRADELPVLIIGSGSTGLALAQGLRKASVKCVVFEKHTPAIGERDWTMGCHWGAPVLKSLMPDDWWSRLQNVHADPHVAPKELDTLTFVQGDNGKTIAAFPVPKFYRLRRSKLRELLSQELDIRYEKRLANVTFAEDETSVTAHFSDGTTTTGSMLVGADGARSTTRQCLLAPQLGSVNRIPYCATFVEGKFSKEQALYLRSFHPLYLATAHPENLFGFFATQAVEDPEDPTSWTFKFYISWQSSLDEQEATAHWTDAQRLAQQKEFAKKFCDPWKSAYEWMPDDTPVWYMGMTEWDPGVEGHRWNNHNGLITLVGDAAHPMTCQRGQGLNHSLTDAGQVRDALVKIRDGADRKQVITEYEDGMIERTGGEVRDCTKNTSLLHDWEKVKQSLFYAKGMTKNH